MVQIHPSLPISRTRSSHAWAPMRRWPPAIWPVPRPLCSSTTPPRLGGVHEPPKPGRPCKKPRPLQHGQGPRPIQEQMQERDAVPVLFVGSALLHEPHRPTFAQDLPRRRVVPRLPRGQEGGLGGLPFGGSIITIEFFISTLGTISRVNGTKIDLFSRLFSISNKSEAP